MIERFFSALLIFVVVTVSGRAALAEDVALIIGNRAYDSFPAAPGATVIADVESAARNAGFTVTTARNLTSDALRQNAREISRQLLEADRVLIFISGHIVQHGNQGWLLLRDAGFPTAMSTGLDGLSIDALIDIAAQKQGAAIVAIGTSPRAISLGSGLSMNYTPGEVPQGVTILTGQTRFLSAFVADALLDQNIPVGDALGSAPHTVTGYGYLPTTVGFLPQGGPVVGPDPDLTAWQQAELLDTVESYSTYLSRFPNGDFASEARARINDLSETPEQRAERVEAALNLSRDQKRDIQRDLTTLGFYNRSIDGLFGRGTRGAIQNWQRQNGFDDYGYLSANQLTLLDAQATRRAAEDAAERERQDRAYWISTGRGQTEDGLRAYLAAFPNGIYSDGARDRLAQIEEQRRLEQEALDNAAWDVARSEHTVQAYQYYLQQFPNGLYADRAERRINRLSFDPALEQARAAEEAMNLNTLTLRLVERRLHQLGFAPGPQDGQITTETRDAIRGYQTARNLPVTGYLSDQMLVLLLAESILR